MGRPTKYDPTKNKDVIDLMSQGGSIVEVAAMLGVDRATVYRWMDAELGEYQPDFRDTIKKGMTLCQAFWEKEGRINLMQSGAEGADKFNTTLWIMNMKARFKDDWAELHKHDHTTKGDKINVINLGTGEPIAKTE